MLSHQRLSATERAFVRAAALNCRSSCAHKYVNFVQHWIIVIACYIYWPKTLQPLNNTGISHQNLLFHSLAVHLVPEIMTLLTVINLLKLLQQHRLKRPLLCGEGGGLEADNGSRPPRPPVPDPLTQWNTCFEVVHLVPLARVSVTRGSSCGVKSVQGRDDALIL